MRIETKARRIQEALGKKLGVKVKKEVCRVPLLGDAVEYKFTVGGRKAPLVSYKVSIGKDGWSQVEKMEDKVEEVIRETLEKLR